MMFILQIVFFCVLEGLAKSYGIDVTTFTHGRWSFVDIIEVLISSSVEVLISSDQNHYRHLLEVQTLVESYFKERCNNSIEKLSLPALKPINKRERMKHVNESRESQVNL